MSKTITFDCVAIPASELKIEAMNPTLKGGQHCGSIPVGVKVTHVPTGLTASSDIARSQLRNRNIAMGMIKWGLFELKG